MLDLYPELKERRFDRLYYQELSGAGFTQFIIQLPLQVPPFKTPERQQSRPQKTQALPMHQSEE